jgi:hypothetical protein
MRVPPVLRILILLVSIVVLAGCANSRAAAPAASPTPKGPLPEGGILFEIDPARRFTGHVHGQGQTVIILANMSAGGEMQWDPLIAALDPQKFTAITFSYLQPDFPGAAQGVLTVLGQVRDAGYRRVVCIGASLGVSGCAGISAEPDVVGMALIAGPNFSAPSSATYPKLFIAAELDPVAQNIRFAYQAAAEPKQLLLFPDTGVHGTTLFYSTVKEQVLKALVDFVNGLP